MRDVLIGVAAGAVGTAALNIARYSAKAIRARASSDVPAQVVGALARKGASISRASARDGTRSPGGIA